MGRFTTLIEPFEDLMHLPDGSTLRRVIYPHPLGGLQCVYEDMTDWLALERSCNTLIAVQRETLGHLAEAVAVFGTDSRLRLFNLIDNAIGRVPAGGNVMLTTARNVDDILLAVSEQQPATPSAFTESRTGDNDLDLAMVRKFMALQGDG